MTVRTTRTGSGSTPRSTRPYAAPRSSHPEAPATPAEPAPEPLPASRPGGDPVAAGGAEVRDRPEHPPPVDDRRARRAARHQRRHLSVACAVLIAVCLVITILIVGMARNRTPGPQTVVPALSLPPGTAGSRLVVHSSSPTSFVTPQRQKEATVDFNQLPTRRRAR
jgi:hypothetical protein